MPKEFELVFGRAGWIGQLDERVRGGFNSVSRANLVVKIGDMALHGAFAEKQFLGDLTVGSSVRQETQNFNFACGEAVGIRGLRGGNRLDPVPELYQPFFKCDQAKFFSEPDGLVMEFGGLFLVTPCVTLQQGKSQV